MDDATINIVHMNGDTLPLMLKDGGEELFRNKYNIAVWYWELSTLRPEWQVSMKYFHEFWAPTPFIEQALKQSTAKPVRLVPPYLSYLSNLQWQAKPHRTVKILYTVSTRIAFLKGKIQEHCWLRSGRRFHKDQVISQFG